MERGIFRSMALALLAASGCQTLKPSAVGSVAATRAGGWGRDRGVCAGGTFHTRDTDGAVGEVRLRSCAGWENIGDRTNAVLGTWLEAPCNVPTLVHTDLWAVELVGENGEVLGVSSPEPNDGPGVCVSGFVNNQVLVHLRNWTEWKPGRYTVRYSFLPQETVLGQSVIAITP